MLKRLRDTIQSWDNSDLKFYTVSVPGESYNNQ
jgi:hypothetical protein